MPPKASPLPPSSDPHQFIDPWTAPHAQGYRLAGEYDRALATVRWGLDWIVKAHGDSSDSTRLAAQVGNGGADHAYWCVLPAARAALRAACQALPAAVSALSQFNAFILLLTPAIPPLPHRRTVTQRGSASCRASY